MTEKKAFVIGHPITHSASPLIHNFWIKQFGINASYEAIDVAPEYLDVFFGSLAKDSFVGGNVTIPHKLNVIKFCKKISNSAKEIGAVNTVHLENGLIMGSNSDHFGFVDNLDQNFPGWAHNLECAVVLGAGGAARAIIYALVKRQVSRIVVLNRTPEGAHQLAKEFGASVTGDALTSFETYAPKTNLLINASAVGLEGTRFPDMNLNVLPRGAIVNDIVYKPLKTPLLQECETLGLRTLDGLGMLLHQAIPGFERWFGVRPEVTPDLRKMIEIEIGVR